MLKFYNTLTREISEFKPINPAEIKIYSCGPTVYNYAHIGNLRAYVFVDILKRVLIYNNYSVKSVMNITDVGHLTSDADTGEDKMEKGAKREGKSAWEVANYYIEAFKKDIFDLNIAAPTILCRATDYIPEQIDLIKKLEDKGFTYITNDGVYFDTVKFSEYSKLARLDTAGLQEGARVEINHQKKNLTDFALWKFSPREEPRQMEWPSPWGKGFPGWHIECSAMSLKYLGDHFDIHTGGIDHVPVHHTNERAQNNCAEGKEVVDRWMHNEFVNIRDGKMAKSGDNFITLQSIINMGYDPLSYRYLLLGAHYRKKVDFSLESLDGAENSYDKLKNKLIDWLAAPVVGFNEQMFDYKNRFLELVNNDLDTPGVLALLWEVIKDTDLSNSEKKTLALEFDKVLGLKLDEVKARKVDLSLEAQELLRQRQKARDNHDWARADALRDQIQELGFLVRDTAEGQEVAKI